MATIVSTPIVNRPARLMPSLDQPTTLPADTRTTWFAWGRAVAAFWRDDDGQDIIEYGLLAAFIGIVCIAVWASIQGHLRDAYLGYDNDVQGLWQPPNPGGSD